MCTWKTLKHGSVKGDILTILLRNSLKRPLDSLQMMKIIKKVNGVPLVVTYNPAFKNLFQVIRKNLQLLYADEEVKKVFSPAPFVSFRGTRNLKSYLVRSKIYPLDRKVGSEKFKSKRCLVFLNVSEQMFFNHFRLRNNIR